MKKCPFCAEEIQDEAIKCKHCGSDLAVQKVRPEIMTRFKKLQARMQSKDYVKFYQVKRESPTVFELWSRVTGVNAFLLVVLLLIGIVPGLLYALVKATEKERRVNRIEIKDNKILRDGKDVTESGWLRERTG